MDKKYYRDKKGEVAFTYKKGDTGSEPMDPEFAPFFIFAMNFVFAPFVVWQWDIDGIGLLEGKYGYDWFNAYVYVVWEQVCGATYYVFKFANYISPFPPNGTLVFNAVVSLAAFIAQSRFFLYLFANFYWWFVLIGLFPLWLWVLGLLGEALQWMSM